MQLKCADYLKEAVNTNIEQIRYSFMSKACKQIAQLLPFQSMWHLLFKQENLFFYMLMLQSMFGQNIKMLLELIIERFAPITQFQIQFLNACTLVFSQDTYILSDVIKSHLPNIYKECITQLQFFIKQIPKNDSQEGQSVAEQIAQAYKTILGNIHDKQVTIELYTSLQQIVHKWPLIHNINPLIFHEVEEIIAMRTPRNVEIQFYEEPTECDSPTKSNSIRKENQIVVELQRWLSKMNYPIPVISKRIGSSVINSQNMFKLKENIEAMLSFIYCPLKYDPANCWMKIEFDQKISLKDIPNLKNCYSLQAPAHIYHIRSIRSLQSLTDEENHQIIAKVNPSYLQIAFSYLSECLNEDNLKNCNFNHLTQLLIFYLEKEQDISIYFCLHYNIPYAFLHYINYEQSSTFLINLFLQINLLGHYITEHQKKLYEQVWTYFNASKLFDDIITILLNPKNRQDLLLKCTSNFRNNNMLEVFTLHPDFQLKEKVYQQNENNFNFTLEEKIHLKWDIDQIKKFVQKKTIKQLSFFNKVSHKILPSFNENPASMMDVIRVAIQNAEIINEPHKKRQPRATRERLIVLRSASVMFDLDEQDSQKDQFIPFGYNLNPLEVRVETKDSNTKYDQKSVSFMRDSQKGPNQKKHSRNLSLQLYPLSLKDVTLGIWDHEQKQDQYQIENLMKDEPFCYNLLQFLSILIQQLILGDHKLFSNTYFMNNRQQMLSVILLNENCKVFDNLMKIYLFKIKLTPCMKENSAVLCGQLVNLIIKKKPEYMNFQDNAQTYIDYLCKVIINSMQWKTSSSQAIELDVGKTLLCETLCLMIEYGINRGQIQLLNRITATTWSCLIEICKYCFPIRPNQTFQGIFIKLMKLNLEFGSEFNIHTIFMKLNFLSIVKQLAELTQLNAVQNKKFNYLNEFINSICNLISNQIIKQSSKECFKVIQNLDSWNQLKLQYKITSHQHANSFYSVDSRLLNNSTPATSHSFTKIRIRKSAHSQASKE
ncbi:unnamed protein product (macronuclear) [Paramecium tetraurelia]|uniref:Uncharacterized protein n=1 Tax=Paramecium tetraurelia TaxID=5888 RepID=A0CM48_PARTE|nr:uncharacterized protein GSPATT00008344001 [Paramecium tetraurelia]CAK71865.1 unnamed protein product [Paramecium tetraurelia]|eukprot:XP_001439262.1 hypothetical protein (macronuclear) [Paramecium tetraurelia strain d4-2]